MAVNNSELLIAQHCNILSKINVYASVLIHGYFCFKLISLLPGIVTVLR